LLAAGLAVPTFSTGCTVDIGGQTLPSPYYMTDDVQYFPPGPEFKLAREAAAMKQRAEEEALREGPPPALP
jgi:hypothetical protein